MRNIEIERQLKDQLSCLTEEHIRIYREQISLALRIFLGTKDMEKRMQYYTYIMTCFKIFHASVDFEINVIKYLLKHYQSLDNPDYVVEKITASLEWLYEERYEELEAFIGYYEEYFKTEVPKYYYKERALNYDKILNAETAEYYKDMIFRYRNDTHTYVMRKE